MVNTGSVVVAPPKTRRPYRSPERVARAHATRKRVLRAAVTLFAERGYAATTIRSVAAKAKVSVPTVETLFGTKARLLKATIDVAIAGDDEPVPMLDRDWATAAIETTDAETFVSIVASVLAPAQGRSSGLVLSVFEGSASDPELAVLAAQMSAQRATMATWVVDRLIALGALHDEIGEDEAVDTLFALMEPALFDRLTRQRDWTLAQYEHWVARSLRCLLVSDAGQRRQSPTDPRRSPT
jgi:AcrR family transcriptional regulator